MAATARISGRSTMREVLEAYPSAQRALFRRYHIGECNSCGYQPEDTLEQVAHRHNIFDLDKVVAFILHAAKVVVDPKSLEFLDGSTLDFVKEGMKQTFKFLNPNVDATCGCGESFNMKSEAEKK